jgi:NADH-quinone oxidoreductase subunit J
MVTWIISALTLASSLGVILVRKPVHACLCFLLTLLMLASLYMQLSAQFIGAMQVLVYGGAILVIFMFVIVLFQDAYKEIDKRPGQSAHFLLVAAGTAFLLELLALWLQLTPFPLAEKVAPDGFGNVETLGKALYLDFFFPFEAVILIFLVAIVGVLYIGKRN